MEPGIALKRAGNVCECVPTAQCNNHNNNNICNVKDLFGTLKAAEGTR